MKSIDIATLFPELCDAWLSGSIIGRARAAGKLQIDCHDIRGFSEDKHRKVDDSPYGGGMGMVMGPVPVYNCIRYLRRLRGEGLHVIYLSPKGKTFTQRDAHRLAGLDRLALVCGHYEGVDQRVLDEAVDEEVSIGDYVLTGGELGALVIADAVGRLCEGVLSDESCYTEESFEDGLLEYPHYTRPPVWRGRAVPEVLLSGHHKNITRWRRDQALALTWRRRPDLLARAALDRSDEKTLSALREEDEAAQEAAAEHLEAAARRLGLETGGENGADPAALEAAARRLGRRLPPALRAYERLLGRAPHGQIVPCEALELSGERLIFAQGQEPGLSWAVDLRDGMVYRREGGSWTAEEKSLCAYLEQVLAEAEATKSGPFI